jgi:hypothetical protein
MKKSILILVIGLGLAFIGSAINCIAQDTIPSIGGALNEIQNTVAASKEYASTWQVMFWCTLAGVLSSIIYQTIKGVKNATNGSPITFAWKYWVKDNALPKIATVLGFLIGNSYLTALLAKLPNQTIFLIVTGLVGYAIGWFLDWVTDFLKVISPKSK